MYTNTYINVVPISSLAYCLDAAYLKISVCELEYKDLLALRTEN